jgi:hypothetical protein
VKGRGWSALVLLAGVAVSIAGLLFGAWWLTFAAGLLVGLMIPRGRMAVPIGALAGLLGWALPLAFEQDQYGLGPTAGSLAAIMGFTGQPAIPLVLSVVVGLLLGLTGAWLASAARSLALPATR